MLNTSSIDAMVPPENPPLKERTTQLVSVSSPAPSSRAAWYRAYTLRSDGTESNPQACTMRAPVSAACLWYKSMLLRMNIGSPVRSA
ncbi:Uncharacterised protein [Mycobacterium tuberculosis]|uniref:Uncharacterized protein n=1 Tax=Mycobacterium tuberculosis TaxID=1773 RepID=A0A0T9F4I3_MYCTX|nr:Uncharacterised protein [Mycobacterium tuberculosis]CFE85913.1 Uncharacterised protein [Mycobacterium tuberculosis]CFS06490.1 Uncharacterised protein [Mycobacterium tuberculosis]CFS21997.1 Uncharacterised protein [Mycobacterium tuberculosis]CFS53075.1 Uncharacterised protein [Mycobacterium tuberculosis]